MMPGLPNEDPSGYRGIDEEEKGGESIGEVGNE